MQKYNLIKVESQEVFDELYNESAFTVCGITTCEESIVQFIEFVEQFTEFKEEKNIYVTCGAYVNVQCDNFGKYSYPNDCNIVSIKLSELVNFEHLVIPRIIYGMKWFDDLVDNHKRIK